MPTGTTQPRGKNAFALVLFALVAGSSTASAGDCTAPDGVLSCAVVHDDVIEPGPWVGHEVPAVGDAGWLNQQLVDNDLGDTCYWWPGEDGELAWTCDDASAYECGAEPRSQEGPEKVFSFQCTRNGTVEINLDGADCHFDIYAIAGACDPSLDCLGEKLDDGVDGSLEIECVAGEERFIVVEGYGFTVPAWQEYVAEPAALGEDPVDGYCSPELPGLFGNFTLSVDPASPGCQEECTNGVDDDGDGIADCDDSDCLGSEFCAPPETCDNGIDDDLDGVPDCEDPDCWDMEYCCDDDGDGFIDVACGGGDCNDRFFAYDGDDDDVPHGCDRCPGHDDNADRDGDGIADGCDACPDTPFFDADGDGAADCEDCDDSDPTRSPLDLDGDGFTSCDDDCDDNDGGRYPGAPELADGIDQDCDGIIDEDTIWSDDDGDGFTEEGGDCDDTQADIHPGAAEICDGVDRDCDGQVDNGTSCFDDDGDGYAEVEGDCHDGDTRIGPHVPELPYNGIDDDCDGRTDDDVHDLDGDGFVESGGDCGPTDPRTHPGAVERPDRIDNDCDGIIDEDTVLADDDGDGTSEREGDCHDGDPSIGPHATDNDTNGIDDDCDGVVDGDRADTETASEISNDLDGDGFEGADDCDDNDGWVHVDAHEFCDGVDNNCDGVIDEGCNERPVVYVSGACSTGGGPTGAWLLVGVLGLLRRRR